MSVKWFFFWVFLFILIEIAFEFAVPRLYPPRWEYRTYYLLIHEDGRYYGNDLELLGKDGWELTEVVPIDSSQHVLYFKKQTW